MKKEINNNKAGFFERLASKVALATGSTTAIILAFTSILVWAISGPFFHYSENWQLVINTGTTTITFLMVFLIQNPRTKNRSLYS